MRIDRNSLNLDVDELLPEVGLSEVLKGGTSAGLERSSLEFGSGESRVEWDLELERVEGGLEIRGTVKGEFELLCDRCLAPYSQGLEVDLREHVLWDIADEGGGEEEEEYRVVDGSIDIEPVLRDVIVLALPNRRLCKPECKGICAGCGVDLNIGECVCEDRPIDGRLEPLVELKERMEAERDGES